MNAAAMLTRPRVGARFRRLPLGPGSDHNYEFLVNEQECLSSINTRVFCPSSSEV